MDFKKLFTKQKMMRTVLWTMLPIYLFSVYLFGWRVLALLLVNILFASIGEYLIMRMINKDNAKVTEAAFVTAALYTLTLPATLPFWMSIVGVLFGIIIGKCIFGGFAKNVFNPALVGRAFIYVSFPVPMTSTWVQPFSSLPGGFTRWLNTTDMITAATPLIQLKKGQGPTPLPNLLIGNTAGSIGETSIILIVLAGLYLMYTKTASWKIIVSTFLSGAVFTFLFNALGMVNFDPLAALLSGGFFFGTVFMATDPVSAPKNDIAKILYGILIGFCTVAIRNFSSFNEGMMFAILVGNAFAPFLDRNIKEWQDKQKAKKAPQTVKEG